MSLPEIFDLNVFFVFGNCNGSILSVIILNSLTNWTPTSRSSSFASHSHEYGPNWTPLGPITIRYITRGISAGTGMNGVSLAHNIYLRKKRLESKF